MLFLGQRLPLGNDLHAIFDCDCQDQLALYTMTNFREHCLSRLQGSVVNVGMMQLIIDDDEESDTVVCSVGQLLGNCRKATIDQYLPAWLAAGLSAATHVKHERAAVAGEGCQQDRPVAHCSGCLVPQGGERPIPCMMH